MADKDLDQIQKILKENDIPTEGESCYTGTSLQSKHRRLMKLATHSRPLTVTGMVYDLTADEEVGKIISKNSKVKN